MAAWITGRWSSIALLLLLAAGATGCAMLGWTRLRFTNELAAPVRLSVGDLNRIVAPGATLGLRVRVSRAQVAEWEMVRPLSADSTPMGEVIRGALVLREPGGTVEGVAGTRQGENDFFAPLITNATSQSLRVTVNAGLVGALDCGCAVRPGARRVFVGYYRLYQNSTVRVRSGGREATFRDLGPQVTTRDGTVGLRFEDKDLRPVNRRGAGSGAPSPR
jgi:hypothetical protein